MAAPNDGWQSRREQTMAGECDALEELQARVKVLEQRVAELEGQAAAATISRAEMRFEMRQALRQEGVHLRREMQAWRSAILEPLGQLGRQVSALAASSVSDRRAGGRGPRGRSR